jgi:hypothetical protein
MKCVMDEGMPKASTPFEKGKLFVFFRILFPQPGELGDAELQLLARALPGPDRPPPAAVSKVKHNGLERRRAPNPLNSRGGGGGLYHFPTYA